MKVHGAAVVLLKGFCRSAVTTALSAVTTALFITTTVLATTAAATPAASTSPPEPKRDGNRSELGESAAAAGTKGPPVGEPRDSIDQSARDASVELGTRPKDTNPPYVPLRAELTGPKTCPTSEFFLSQIMRRTPKASRALGGEVGWTLRVSVSEQRSRHNAKLTILANEGTWLERELTAPSCDDAVEALAVVVAVLVETAAEQAKQRQAERALTAGSGNPVDAARPTDRSVPLPHVAGGVWVPWLDDPTYFERRGIVPVTSHYVKSIVATVELDSQLTDHFALGLGLGFEVTRWHPNLLNPSYGISIGWAAGDYEAPIVRMNLSRLSLRGVLCPVELLRHRHFALRPCARGELGWVYATVEELTAPSPSYTKRFLQARTTPFVRFSFIPIAGAEIRLDGGVDFEVYRPTYRLSVEPLSTGGREWTFSPPRQAPYAATGLSLDW